MTSNVERKEGGGGALLLVLVLVIGGVMFTLIANNAEHATKKHAHAPTLREAHEEGLCRRQEAYVSLQRGTLLVLCKMDANLWGGIVWKVLEYRNGQHMLMDRGQMYECTAFAADRAYWHKVIARDGYVKAHDTQWYNPLQWLIHP